MMEKTRQNSSNLTTSRRWDVDTASPWYNYQDGEGVVHQIWYDDPKSLQLKYAVAKELGFRGVGPFRFDGLGYGSPAANADSAAMWAALRTFLKSDDAAATIVLKSDDKDVPSLFPAGTAASHWMRNPVAVYSSGFSRWTRCLPKIGKCFTPSKQQPWPPELLEPLFGYEAENGTVTDTLFDSAFIIGYDLNGKTMTPEPGTWANNSHSYAATP